MAAENDLGRDDIKKLVVRIAIPSMLAQFVSVLYSIVDRMYIGNIPGSGDMALAGAGVCGPVRHYGRLRRVSRGNRRCPAYEHEDGTGR